MASATDRYYLPHNSYWPILGSIGLCALFVGFARVLTGASIGSTLMIIGALVVVLMLAGWFGTVIRESQSGSYNLQVDRSYRWGMSWFIFSEVMFFGAFFAALFYARVLSVPWLGGAGGEVSTHLFIWPEFVANWPLLQLPDASQFDAARAPMEAAGIPALNTLILLSSGGTITWAHWGLKAGRRRQLIIGLILTISLGLLFLALQAYEYRHAFIDLNLTINSGIYGTTFIMLTGFHGLHVAVGAIILMVILGRSIAGHFTPLGHFAFEASAWYWHFVDVVWLLLFTFVYWL